MSLLNWRLNWYSEGEETTSPGGDIYCHAELGPGLEMVPPTTTITGYRKQSAFAKKRSGRLQLHVSVIMKLEMSDVEVDLEGKSERVVE